MGLIQSGISAMFHPLPHTTMRKKPYLVPCQLCNTWIAADSMDDVKSCACCDNRESARARRYHKAFDERLAATPHRLRRHSVLTGVNVHA